ncbi:MAG: hypothetical protein ACLSHM_01200 [Vescimonas sp.]
MTEMVWKHTECIRTAYSYVTSENSYAYPYDTDKAIELLESSGWVDTDGDGIQKRTES